MKKLHQSAETVTTGDVSEALRLLFGQPVDEDQADVLVAALPNLSKVMLDLLQCTRDAGKPGIFMRIPGRFDVNAPARITIMNAHPGALCTMQIGYTLWAPADLELDVLLVSAAGDSDHAFAVTDDGLREGRIALGLEASLQPGMLRAMLRLHGLTALVADDRHRCRRATA